MNPKVAIILLNWNSWKDTVECLESLYQINYQDYYVIVVDNASSDGSLEKIREYCRGKIKVESSFFKYNPHNKPVKLTEYTKEESEKINISLHDNSQNKELILIKNHENYGFAQGNNIGIKYALNSLKTDYILFLNNDTVVDINFLGELIKVSENHPDIGFVGPKTYYYNFNNRHDVINFAGGSLNMFKGRSRSIGVNEVDECQHEEIKIVDYVEGSCSLAKKEVLEEIGLFDPKYFAYWEEVDLCIRGYKAGYKSMYVPEAKIWHKVSSSVHNPLKIYYYTRNNFWFMEKYANKREYIVFLLCFFGFYFWNLNYNYIKSSLYEKDLDHNSYFLKGIINGLFIK